MISISSTTVTLEEVGDDHNFNFGWKKRKAGCHLQQGFREMEIHIFHTWIIWECYFEMRKNNYHLDTLILRDLVSLLRPCRFSRNPALPSIDGVASNHKCLISLGKTYWKSSSPKLHLSNCPYKHDLNTQVTVAI